MKKRHLILLLSLFHAGFSHAQYIWSNPQTSNYTNTSIVFNAAATGFIMNDHGDLMKTTDTGATWQAVQHFPNCSVLDLYDSTGVIAGYGGAVYISGDDGTTWRRRSIGTNVLFGKVEIVSRDTIFLVSSNLHSPAMLLYQSTDRGNTWNLINKDFHIKAIDFVTATLGFASSYGGIFKTTDGGKTWTNVFGHSTSAHVIAVAFRDAANGYAYREGHGILQTADGGATWTVSSSAAGLDLNTFFFVNDSTTYAAGAYAAALKTTNNGKTWDWSTTAAYTYGANIQAACFLDETTGFLVGLRGHILKTMDGGKSWQPYAPTYIDVRALDFATDSVGYAATWNHMYKTTDAGEHWVRQGLTTQERFQYLHFFNRNTGIAITHSPVVIHRTTNGGASWQTVSLPTLYHDDLSGISFFNNTGYISTTGFGNQILKTDDAGATWQLQLNTHSITYGDLHFTSGKTGFATSGYYIFKTEDSARTWTQMHNIPQELLSGFWFTNAKTGYVFGNQGYYARTNDSGRTWNRQNIIAGNSNFYDIQAMRFFNEKIGYLLSANGDVMKTFDGGDTWLALERPPYPLHLIRFTQDTNVYLAGAYGGIIKRSLKEYHLDSLRWDSLSACGALVRANVSAVLSKVDSIWFEYGAADFSQSVVATPFSVTDSSARAAGRLPNLSPKSRYKVRVKIQYNGSFFYSDSILLTTLPLSAPAIRQEGGALISSATAGNQWFLNNAPISGATASTYTPLQTGNYTVQQNMDGCLSPLSDPFNYTITAIEDPTFTASLTLFPNPASHTLYLLNRASKRLQVRIVDANGKKVKEVFTAKKEERINMQGLPAGVYFVWIQELRTGKVLRRTVLKW